jgi:hypothetical protein
MKGHSTARPKRRRRLVIGAVASIASATAFALSATPGFSSEGSVNATVTASAPCLIIQNASIDFGTAEFSTSTAEVRLAKPQGASTIRSCSSSTQNLFARGTNATGNGALPATWTLGAPAVCSATNRYVAGTSRTGFGTSSLSTANVPFGTLAGDASDGLAFSMTMPCTGSSGAGQVMTFSYLYTATF